MKKLINKEKSWKQINIYPLFKQFNETVKEMFICLFYIFIFVFSYYIFICTYNLGDDDCEIINVCTIKYEEVKSVNQSNLWYKSIIDDFFNKFSSKGKIVDYKFIEIKSEVKTLMPLEHYSGMVKKSVILNKIQSDFMKSIVLECEFYKNKASLLELQLLKTKISYQDLIKDINDIVKEMNGSSKKS